MNTLRTIVSGLIEGMAPDGTLVKVRLRITLDSLLTLLVSIIAIGLTVGYQVLRHLPESWRESLLGDSAPPE